MDKNSTGKNVWAAIVIVIIVFIFFSVTGSCSTKNSGSFLNKDPRTWTQDEKRQYNQWQDWESKQKDD